MKFTLLIRENLINLLIPLGIMICAILMRLAPHPPNFTPILAIGLFSGYAITDKRISWVLPLVIMFVSDFFIGFHSLMSWVYVSIIACSLIGQAINRDSLVPSVVGRSFVASLLFFLVTNFGVWIQSSTFYAKNVAGLIQCYVAGIPFFGYTVMSTCLYSFVIFSGYGLVKKALAHQTSSRS